MDYYVDTIEQSQMARQPFAQLATYRSPGSWERPTPALTEVSVQKVRNVYDALSNSIGKAQDERTVVDLRRDVSLPTTTTEITSPANAEQAPAQAEDRPSKSQLVGRAEKIANERVRLMVAKYAQDSHQAEIVARLELLNRRLLEVSPRVYVKQVEALERDVDRVASITARRQALASQLGIGE